MLRETVNFRSPMYASCGTTAEKSAPGFAVPDSVHQVKLVDPRKFPLRWTVTCADGSLAATSTVSVANSSFDAPAEAADTGRAVTPWAAAAGGAATGGAAAGAGSAATRAGGAAAGGTATGPPATRGVAAGWRAADDAAGAGARGVAAGASCEAGAGIPP